MKLTLNLHEIKPLNLNHCYTISSIGGKIRRFPSSNYKKYESQVNLLLRQYKNEINKFNNYYNPDLHYLVADYNFFYPILTKKEKKISQKSTDLSNSIKALEDIIFKSFTADDSAVCSLNINKIHSENIRAEITFYIKDIKFIN